MQKGHKACVSRKKALFRAFIKKTGKKCKDIGQILLALFFELVMSLRMLMGLNVFLWVFPTAEFIT